MVELSKNIRMLLENGEKIYYKNRYTSAINPLLVLIELGTSNDYTHYLFLDGQYGLFMIYDRQSNQTKHADLSIVKEIFHELVKQQKNTSSFLSKFQG